MYERDHKPTSQGISDVNNNINSKTLLEKHERDHKPKLQVGSDRNNNLDCKTQREMEKCDHKLDNVFDNNISQKYDLNNLVENKTLWNMFQSD